MTEWGPPVQERNSSLGWEACPGMLSRYDKHPTPPDLWVAGRLILDAATGRRFCQLSPRQNPTAPPGMHPHTSKHWNRFKHLHSTVYKKPTDTELNQNNPSLWSIYHVHVRTATRTALSYYQKTTILDKPGAEKSMIRKCESNLHRMSSISQHSTNRLKSSHNATAYTLSQNFKCEVNTKSHGEALKTSEHCGIPLELIT